MPNHVHMHVHMNKPLGHALHKSHVICTYSIQNLQDKHLFGCIQWNLSNQDTIGPDYNVLNSEVSLSQGLLSTQMCYLGQMKVSCL